MNNALTYRHSTNNQLVEQSFCVIWDANQARLFLPCHVAKKDIITTSMSVMLSRFLDITIIRIKRLAFQKSGKLLLKIVFLHAL